MKSLLQNPAAPRAAAVPCRWRVVLLLLLSLPAFGQNATDQPVSSGRFLLLVDTSYPMRRHAEGVLQTVEALLNADLGGRLRPGDTIGLWTFNEDVYTGRFPLQQWSPATRRAVTANVLDFLKRQRFEKKTKLDKVLAKALPLVRESPAITFVLLTDGRESVHGTPFDATINAIFQANRREQVRVRMPFATVLRAEQGQLVNGNVGLPPWRIDVPATPGEIARANKPPPPEKPPPAKPVTPKPAPADLILRGPKPAETPVAKLPEKPVEQPNPEPVPPAKPPPATEVKPVAATVAQPPSSDPTRSPTSPESPATSPVAAPAPTPAPPLAETSIPVPPAQAGQVLEVAKPDPPPPEPVKPPGVEKPHAATPAAPAAAGRMEEVKPAPTVTTESKPAPAAPLPQPEVKPAPVPELASAQTLPAEKKLEAAKLSSPLVVEAKPEPPARVVAESSKAAPSPLPVQESMMAPQPFLSGPRLLVLGLLLLAVAGVLFWFIARRSRAVSPSGSLISQSLERDKKQ